MADFCHLCSTEGFGEDFCELANLSTPEDTRKGKYCVVICEGCGPIQVDHEGNCISSDCYEKHGLTEFEGG